MAGTTFKKRSRDDPPRAKPIRPSKKQKKQAHAAYHSSSSSASEAEEDGDDFQAVNLLDSDEEDIHNAQVDDGAGSQSDDASGSSSSGSEENERGPAPRSKKNKPTPSIARDAPQSKLAKDAPSSDEDDDHKTSLDDSDDDDEEQGDEYSDLDDSAAGSGDDDTDGDGAGRQKRNGSRSKRNDPEAFATSMSKILGTKLSSSRRADPVLARSAAAHEAGQRAADGALEAKARKKMREAKRAAMEKGRVRDVLVATGATFGANVNPATGDVGAGAGGPDGATVGERLETERRLRKVAQRGVVQLFNAFRTAQVKAAEAERGVRREGVVGVDRKKEKIAEMSKKGFLDLIAAGGGGLKKGPLEEA